MTTTAQATHHQAGTSGEAAEVVSRWWYVGHTIWWTYCEEFIIVVYTTPRVLLSASRFKSRPNAYNTMVKPDLNSYALWTERQGSLCIDIYTPTVLTFPSRVLAIHIYIILIIYTSTTTYVAIRWTKCGTNRTHHIQGYLWYTYGILMIYLWYTYGILMVCINAFMVRDNYITTYHNCMICRLHVEKNGVVLSD